MSPLIMRIVSQTELQVSSTDQKLSDIMAAVVEQLQTSCGECAPEMIDNQFFVCYPESPSHVTYRARLEGTSERGSDSLISLIDDWVKGGPGVIVTGVLMTVDSHCSVAISSLSEPECPQHIITDPTIISEPPPPEPPNTDPVIDMQDTGATSDTTGIVAGAVVAVIVIVLIIAVTIFAIVFLVLKSRRGEKKADRKCVDNHFYPPRFCLSLLYKTLLSIVFSDMSQHWWERLPSQPLPMRPTGK